MNRDELLRARINQAAADAGELAVALSALASHPTLSTPKAVGWLRSIEIGIDNCRDPLRWLHEELAKTPRVVA